MTLFGVRGAAAVSVVCLVGAMVGVALLLTACGGGHSRPVNVLVLMDNTSFADRYWDESKKAAQEIVLSLAPCDRFQVNEIDDSSGEDEDVLVAPEVLSPRAIYAKQALPAIHKKVGALKAKTHREPGSDILGALREAADVLSRNKQAPKESRASKYAPLLVICSDMRPDFRDPKAAYAKDPFKFPEGTRVRCLFVVKETSTTGVDRPADEDRRSQIDKWRELFKLAGVTVDSSDFRKVEESRTDSETNRAALREFVRSARAGA